MAHQLIEPSTYTEQPWRNGQGTTTQLLAADDGAGSFLWRLSIAPVLSDGPFSNFSGYDRTLVLLEGRALTLDYGAHGRDQLDEPLSLACFSGDWATTGLLGAGPIRDFNVMVRRDRFRAQVRTGQIDELPESVGGQELLYAPYESVAIADSAGTLSLARHQLLHRSPAHGPMRVSGGALIHVLLLPSSSP